MPAVVWPVQETTDPGRKSSYRKLTADKYNVILFVDSNDFSVYPPPPPKNVPIPINIWTEAEECELDLWLNPLSHGGLQDRVHPTLSLRPRLTVCYTVT